MTESELKEKLALPELTFREKDHTYWLNGSMIPGVTSLMRPLSDTLYKTVDQTALQVAADRGSAVHESIELFHKYGVRDCPEEFAAYFNAYFEWYKAFRVEVLANEVPVYHKIYRYAGTADLLCLIRDELWLIDLKTTSQLNHMLTSVQLAAYNAALTSHGVRTAHKGVLLLKKNGKYTFDEARKEDDDEAWTTFGALMTVHSHIERYKKG